MQMSRILRIFHLLQQANSALFRSADSLLKSQEGIVTAHQVILFTLVANDGLTSAEVANRAGMSRSRLTGLLNTLVEKGLVRREQSITDGRVQHIFIEAAGSSLIDRSKSLVNNLNEDLLRPFNVNQREIIKQFLEHVLLTATRIAQKNERIE